MKTPILLTPYGTLRSIETDYFRCLFPQVHKKMQQFVKRLHMGVKDSAHLHTVKTLLKQNQKAYSTRVQEHYQVTSSFLNNFIQSRFPQSKCQSLFFSYNFHPPPKKKIKNQAYRKLTSLTVIIIITVYNHYIVIGIALDYHNVCKLNFNIIFLSYVEC